VFDYDSSGRSYRPPRSRRPPVQCISLLLHLEGEWWVPVPELPDRLRNLDLLRTCDRYGLILFRRLEWVDEEESIRVTRRLKLKIPGVTERDYFRDVEFNFVDRDDCDIDGALYRCEEAESEYQPRVRLSKAGEFELSEWRLRQSDISSGAAANEICLAEAAMRYDVPRAAWTRAAKLPDGAPGHLPTRQVGRSRFVTIEHARRFARDYHARRELRMLGTESGRITRALPKRIQWRQQDEEDNCDRN